MKMTTDRKRHHTTPHAYPGDWTKPGLLYTGQLMHHLGISRTGLRDLIVTGTVPKPDGKIGRRPYWFTQSIAPLLGVRASSTE